jgi:hypothetical protein
MTEYKKEISVAAIIAVIAALALGTIAITALPGASGPPFNGSQTTYYAYCSCTTPPPPSNSTVVVTSTHVSAPPVEGIFAEDVSCPLAAGNCAFTIVNNGTSSAELQGCQMGVIVNHTVISSTTVNEESDVNATLVVGGSAIVSIIPAGSSATATCTPNAQFVHAEGLLVGGVVNATLVSSSNSVGTETLIHFESTWS